MQGERGSACEGEREISREKERKREREREGESESESERVRESVRERESERKRETERKRGRKGGAAVLVIGDLETEAWLASRSHPPVWVTGVPHS